MRELLELFKDHLDILRYVFSEFAIHELIERESGELRNTMVQQKLICAVSARTCIGRYVTRLFPLNELGMIVVHVGKVLRLATVDDVKKTEVNAFLRLVPPMVEEDSEAKTPLGGSGNTVDGNVAEDMTRVTPSFCVVEYLEDGDVQVIDQHTLLQCVLTPKGERMFRKHGYFQSSKQNELTDGEQTHRKREQLDTLYLEQAIVSCVF